MDKNEETLKREMDEAVALGAFGRMICGVSLAKKTEAYWDRRILRELFFTTLTDK